MPVSILLENPPQGVAAAEIASDTADTYDKSTIHTNKKAFAYIDNNMKENTEAFTFKGILILGQSMLSSSYEENYKQGALSTQRYTRN